MFSLRRRRGTVFKCILLIPILWFSLLIYYSILPNESEEVMVKRARDRHNRKVEDIVGFGPPIKVEVDESVGGKTEDSPAERIQKHQQQNANLPLPAVIVDPRSPIYKHGDPKQAGEGGKAVSVNKAELDSTEKKKYDDGWTDNAFNLYASDMISIRRALPNASDAECMAEPYMKRANQAAFSDVSVVICFHNEAWSVLLRTVHSILDRTPEHLLKQIILVDDFSDKEFVKKPLDDYMSQLSDKVKIVRLPQREGLIRARLRGGEAATAKTLIFLDSHCECAPGWIEPLLERIAEDPKTVVCPVIDVIDDTTFEYHFSKAAFTNVGGFDWSLQFNWHSIPERDRKNRKRAIDPVPSPTMAGGLFAIDKAYFDHLGTYDPGFDIWGGENLELSFKIWMCGGRLEIAPCSHVGHIFRKRSPYKWRTGVNVLKRNSIRLAEVWLDEYKKFYYERINNQLGDFGDVSERHALRKNLQCKSFKWYLDNIFPELFIPSDAIASGEVRAQGLNKRMCLDSAVGKQYKDKPITPYPCHNQGGNQVRNQAKPQCLDAVLDDNDDDKDTPLTLFGCHLQGGNQVRNNGGGAKMCLDYAKKKDKKFATKQLSLYWCHKQGGNQYWMLSKDGEIRRDESCVDFAGSEVMIYPCHGMKGNQLWKYDHEKHQLYHKVSDKCLEMTKDGAKLKMEGCDTSNEYQQWVFQTYDEAKAKEVGML